MAIKNINMIQNISDIKDITSYTNEYLIQSLSNLGQRFAPKGDSIEVKTFHFYDILNRPPKLEEFEDDTLVKGIIEYNPSKEEYDFYYTIFDDNTENISNLNKFSTLGDEKFLLNQFIKFNGDDIQDINIEQLTSAVGGMTDICFAEASPNYYNIGFFGKDENGNYSEFVFEQFDKELFTLNQGVRFFKYTDKNDEITLHCQNLRINVDDKTYEVIEYVYKNDPNNPACIFNTLLEPAVFTNDAYLNYHLILKDIVWHYKEQFGVRTYDNFIENSLLARGQKIDETTYTGFSPLLFNVETEEPIYYGEPEIHIININKESGSKFMPLIHDDNTTLSNTLRWFTEDSVYVGKFVRDLFKTQFYQDELSVQRSIVATIANRIYQNSGLKLVDDNKYLIYIPYDYTFEYFTDTTGDNYIYTNAKNVYNEYTQYIYSDYYHVKTSEILISTHSTQNKVCELNYYVEYAKDMYNNIYIVSMDSTIVNTLPYVYNDYWYINNKETKYKSRGENAGNPNIILYYSNYIGQEPKLIGGAFADELKTLGFEKEYGHTYVTVKSTKVIDPNIDFVVGTEDEAAIVEVQYPVIPGEIANNANYMPYLQNSLLVNMTPIQNISYNIFTTYTYTYDYIADYDIYTPGKVICDDLTTYIKSEVVKEFSDTNWERQNYTAHIFNGPNEFSDFNHNYCYNVFNNESGNIVSYLNTKLFCIIPSKTDNFITYKLCEKYYGSWQTYTYSYQLPPNDPNSVAYHTQEIMNMKYGYNGMITTLWELDCEYDNTKKLYTYFYKPIHNPRDYHYALDLNAMTSVNDLLAYQVKYGTKYPEPDNYLYTQVVFDNCYLSLKNTDPDMDYPIYPNISNMMGIDIAGAESIDIQGSPDNPNVIKNNCNFVIKYSYHMTYNDYYKTIEELNQSYIVDNEGQKTIKQLRWIESLDDGKIQPFHKFDSNKVIVPEKIGYNSYVFNADVPVLELKEVFTKDINVLNRTNIVSLDGNGYMYNAYLGSSIVNWHATNYDDSVDDLYVHELKLGTSNSNINIGTETLMWPDVESHNDRHKFKKFNDFAIEFPDNVSIRTTYTYIKGEYTYINTDFTYDTSYTYNWNHNINYKSITNILDATTHSYVGTYNHCYTYQDGHFTISYLGETDVFAYTYHHNGVITHNSVEHKDGTVIDDNILHWRKTTIDGINYYNTIYTPILKMTYSNYNEFNANNSAIHKLKDDYDIFINEDRFKAIDTAGVIIKNENVSSERFVTILNVSYLFDKHNNINWSNVKLTTPNQILKIQDNVSIQNNQTPNIINGSKLMVLNGSINVLREDLHVGDEGTWNSVCELPQISCTYWNDSNDGNIQSYITIQEIHNATWQYPGSINLGYYPQLSPPIILNTASGPVINNGYLFFEKPGEGTYTMELRFNLTGMNPGASMHFRYHEVWNQDTMFSDPIPKTVSLFTFEDTYNKVLTYMLPEDYTSSYTLSPIHNSYILRIEGYKTLTNAPIYASDIVMNVKPITYNSTTLTYNVPIEIKLKD